MEASGYERLADHIGRLSRFEFSVNGDEPVATVGVPGGNVAVLASETVDLEAEKRRAAERAERTAQGDHARRGQARQPGLRGQGPEAVVAAERAKLEQLKKELEELS